MKKSGWTRLGGAVLAFVMVFALLPIANAPALAAPEGTGLINELESMARGFEQNLAAAQRIMDSGGFLAPIGAPDPNAIKIYTARDLDNVRNNLGGSFVLMSDIDLSEFNGGEWVPIGSSLSNAFSGKFDGQGHKIRNMRITEAHEYAGLFGYAKGLAIVNVGLVDSNIYVSSYNSYVGGIVGYSPSTTIENCYNTGDVSSSSYAGGIMGYSYSTTTVENCIVSCDSIVANGKNSYSYIIGYGASTKTNNGARRGIKGDPVNDADYLFDDDNSESGVFTNQPNSAVTIIVCDYDTKDPIPGAQVAYSAQFVTTDSDGAAGFIVNPGGTLTVTQSGYCDYEWKTPAFTSEVFFVFLRKDTVPGAPYVSTVPAIKTGGGFRDGGGELDLAVQWIEVEDDSSDAYRIAITANWRGQTPGKYLLTQEGVREESTSGVFDIQPGKVFKPGKKIYAQIVSAEGAESPEVALNLFIKSKVFDSSPEKGGFSLGREMGFSFPEDWFLIGGMNFELDFGFFPVMIEKEGNKLKVLIGINDEFYDLNKVAEGKSPFENWDVKKGITEDIAEGRKVFDEVKKIYGTDKKPFSNLKMGKGKERLLYEVAGYMEIFYGDNGEIIDTTGYVLLMLGGEYSYEAPYSIMGCPMVFEIKFDGKATFMTPVSISNGLLFPKSSLKLEIGLQLGTGIGVPKIASIQVYGKLGIAVLWDWGNEYDNGTLSGELGLKAKILLYSNEWPIFHGEFTLYEHYWNQPSTQSMTMSALAAPDIYDTSQYDVVPKDYITSGWYAAPQPRMRAMDAVGTDGATTLQSGVYPYASPEIAEVGGKRVMVWVGDSEGRSEINRTTLFYSVYDGNSWSEPLAVWDNGAADMEAVLRSDGTNLYVVWQKMSGELNDEAALDDIAQYCEIASAKFDINTGAFVDAGYLTNDGFYDFLPNAAIDSAGQPVYTWIKNTDNSVFAMTGALYANGVQIHDFQKPVLSYDVRADLGQAVIVASCDEDMDLMTTEDTELYEITQPQVIKLTENDVEDAMPRFDGNTLYWMQDGQLITDSGDAVTQYIGADYRLLHGDGKTALVWTTAIDETRSGILASILQPDGAWGIATLLCEYEGSIAFWDGWIENGWNFVVTATDGQTAELAHIKAFPKTETVLTLVENDERELNADGTLPIKLHVTNTGELGASAFDVAVTGSGYSFSQTVTQELNPGKSGVIELNIPMPGLSAEQEFVVSAYPANESDLSDNESVITLGKHDLKLAVTEYSIGDSVIIAATVTNLTQADTAASIRLESSGATVTSADLGVITNGTQSIFFFELDRNMIVFENGVKLYTLTVESGFDEMSDVNNVASILVSDYSAGAAVTGTVASYNPGAATTLKLLQGETEVGLAIIEPAAGTGEAEQAFAFEGVAPGTYTLVVTKPGHAKYTVHNIVVGETDADLALIALPCGDVNGDGNINGNDLTELWKAANYNKQADDADNPLCDLNGDGNINGTDLTILWLAANYNKGAVIVE